MESSITMWLVITENQSFVRNKSILSDAQDNANFF